MPSSSKHMFWAHIRSTSSRCLFNVYMWKTNLPIHASEKPYILNWEKHKINKWFFFRRGKGFTFHISMWINVSHGTSSLIFSMNYLSMSSTALVTGALSVNKSLTLIHTGEKPYTLYCGKTHGSLKYQVLCSCKSMILECRLLLVL